MKKTFICMLVFAAALVLAGVIAGTLLDAGSATWTPERIEQSKRIGDRILAACAAYHSEHGQFPPTLESLVPRYIDRIDPPIAGSETWEYSQSRGRCFLSFGQGKHLYPCYFRSSDKEEWQLND